MADKAQRDAKRDVINTPTGTTRDNPPPITPPPDDDYDPDCPKCQAQLGGQHTGLHRRLAAQRAQKEA